MPAAAITGGSGASAAALAVAPSAPVPAQEKECKNEQDKVVAAAEYGADEQLAAQGAAISTLACFVVTPVLMLLL